MSQHRPWATADDSGVENFVKSATARCAALVRDIQVITGDLSGLGPAAERDVTTATGQGVIQHLDDMLVAARTLRDALHACREPHLAAQLANLRAKPPRVLKLNIGGGRFEVDDWVNVDVFPAQVAMDLRWGLPFTAGDVRYIFMSHVLEHLYYPHEALSLLRDIRRVLSADGVVRIVLPDIEKGLRAYVANDHAFFAQRRRIWWWWPERDTPLGEFLEYAGAGPDPGAFFQSHKFGYDFATLNALLGRAGFSHVVRSSFQASADPVLRIDDASHVSPATHDKEHYSLFVEARP
jgi:SAM-dependent methyltransferase